MQRGRPVEQLQGAADHAHQALALVRHVALEQMAQRRVGAEQVVVEQGGGVARDRLDQGEGAAHEGDLLNVHGRAPGSEAESLRRPCRNARFAAAGVGVSFVRTSRPGVGRGSGVRRRLHAEAAARTLEQASASATTRSTTGRPSDLVDQPLASPAITASAS